MKHIGPMMLALIAVALLAFPAQAQTPKGKATSKHGAWSIICDVPSGASSEQCALMQNVVAEDRKEVGLRAIILLTLLTALLYLTNKRLWAPVKGKKTA